MCDCVFGAVATLRDSHTENFITAPATTRTKPGFRLFSAFVFVTVMPLGGTQKGKAHLLVKKTFRVKISPQFSRHVISKYCGRMLPAEGGVCEREKKRVMRMSGPCACFIFGWSG